MEKGQMEFIKSLFVTTLPPHPLLALFVIQVKAGFHKNDYNFSKVNV